MPLHVVRISQAQVGRQVLPILEVLLLRGDLVQIYLREGEDLVFVTHRCLSGARNVEHSSFILKILKCSIVAIILCGKAVLEHLAAHYRRETGAWAIVLRHLLEGLLAHEVNRLYLVLIVHDLHLVLIADVLESHAAHRLAHRLLLISVHDLRRPHSVCCPFPGALPLNALARLLVLDAVSET